MSLLRSEKNLHNQNLAKKIRSRSFVAQRRFATQKRNTQQLHAIQPTWPQLPFAFRFNAEKEQASEVPNQDREAQTGFDSNRLPGGVWHSGRWAEHSRHHNCG